MKNLKSLSFWAIVGFFIIGFVGLYNQARWNNPDKRFRVIYWDVVSYYAYLPATFIYHDISLSFANSEAIKNSNDIVFWGNPLPNSKQVIKTTMGVAFFYAPFFAVAHLRAHFSHGKYAPNGFSLPYHRYLAFSGLFWGCIALFVLRKLLKIYYSDWVVALGLVTVSFATNFYNYTVYEGCVAHIYGFLLITCFTLCCVHWTQKITLRNSMLLGFLAGFIILLRPTNIVVLVIPIFLGVTNWQSFRLRLNHIFSHFSYILVSAFCAFLAFLPQLLYWKYVTGSYLFFSYGNERFFWQDPKLIEFVLGYRKGWLVYSPAMVFGILGLFLLQKKARAFAIPIVLVMGLSIYALSCWWAWWFGGSFGSRSLVDFYGLMAVPICAFFSYGFDREKRKQKTFFWVKHVVFCSILAFFIHLNMYQTRQYRTGLIHWDGMTKQSYWAIFLQNHYPPYYDNMIKQPDYEAAMEGKNR